MGLGLRHSLGDPAVASVRSGLGMSTAASAIQPFSV
jgi:hypothetical protein